MAHPVDVHVGQRVRQRRLLLGMTTRQLGESVGVKFQQIQKYERGVDRISASRMWSIAAAVDVPISSFFEGLVGHVPDVGKVRGDPLTDDEALDVVSTYYAIPESKRKRLFDLVSVFGAVA